MLGYLFSRREINYIHVSSNRIIISGDGFEIRWEEGIIGAIIDGKLRWVGYSSGVMKTIKVASNFIGLYLYRDKVAELEGGIG